MRLPAFEENGPRLEQGFQKRVILQRRWATPITCSGTSIKFVVDMANYFCEY